MPQIEFNAKIAPDLPSIVPEAISFETGATRSQAADPALFVYEHHGTEFSQADPGALTSFFEDLILGRPLPLTFATRQIRDIDTIFALALFFDRTLAIHPAMPGIVAAADLVHRRGAAILGHIDADLGRFFRVLRSYFPEEGLSKRELGERLTKSVGWIKDFMDGRPPVLGVPWPEVRVLDIGTNGFVLAETLGSLPSGWVELYRKGFLRGLLVGPDRDSRRAVLVARKSTYVDFDLTTAASILNEVELTIGEMPEWRADLLWLWGPEEGTLLRITEILEILKRV